jgi:tRNA A-37 threonylcarbamoyl transferase component Bud32
VEISTGTVIGGYVVRERLGTGGMGSVYLVRHPTLPRDVALKVLHAGLSATPAMRARFEREAELLSRLSHPNVVDVLDRGQQGDLLWMAMQYVPGPDLAALLERSGALPPERALDIVAAIGNALDHAHACGLLHRDVKPANILLATIPGGGERVMLTDFGIGRDMTASSALTQDGEVVASFAYASPEQVSGAAVDARADVYSLGAVLFELLTGRRAFDADSLPALLYAVVHAPPPDVRAVRPDLPPAISGVLARALAKDPADRFGSCAELVAAARACWPARVPAPETAVGPVPVPPPPQRSAAPTRSRRGPLLAAAAALVVVAVGVAVLVIAPWRGEADDPASSPSATGSTTQARSGGLQDWGEAQFVVDDFPSLLPATPADEGWGGGSCGPTAFAEDVHADVGLTCSYDNGITAEVTHYPDVASRDARRAELEEGDAADSPENWAIDGARAGIRLFSEDDPQFIWQWIMFNQPDKALYVVILEWEGHTHAELDDAWFSQAPFTGPAGT